MQKAIIDYIVSLKDDKLSHSTIHVLLAAIYHFCEMSDIVINKKRIRKYKGERIRVVRDRAYAHDEISMFLNLGDIRIKAIVLLMASSGIRVGSVPSLQIRHLQKMKDCIYKIVIYENSNDEYFTFCTPECGKAIDAYLEYRKRNGEVLMPDSYLIRKQFDIRDLQQIKNSNNPISLPTLRGLIDCTAIKAGLRSVKHGNMKRERKQLALTHAFRKFFTNQLVNSKVNPEIREMLLGHKIGLAGAYYRPSEDDILNEYIKAIDALTINEENRLKRKVEKLEVEKSRMDSIELQIAEMRQLVSKNLSPL